MQDKKSANRAGAAAQVWCRLLAKKVRLSGQLSSVSPSSSANLRSIAKRLPSSLQAARNKARIFIYCELLYLKVLALPPQNHDYMTHLRRAINRLLPGLLLATACTAASAVASQQQLQDACRPGSGSDTVLPGVQIRKLNAGSGDLPYYEARSDVTGSSVRIYHEPHLGNAAASKAACLMGMLDLLSTNLPHLSGQVRWSPMVLTDVANYIPPKRDGELRWHTVFKSTTWEPENLRFLLVVMPHEETHLSQKIGGPSMPRWFAEGHAEWAGLQVTEQVAPVLATAERAKRAEEFRKLGTAHLGSWGGIRVKPEAIERQLSADDRERRKRDPTFTPPGPFTFGPADIVQDDGNEGGRYGAALALFTSLEQRHGKAAVQGWVRAVLEGKDAAQIVPLARKLLGEDLMPLLK